MIMFELMVKSRGREVRVNYALRANKITQQILITRASAKDMDLYHVNNHSMIAGNTNTLEPVSTAVAGSVLANKMPLHCSSATTLKDQLMVSNAVLFQNESIGLYVYTANRGASMMLITWVVDNIGMRMICSLVCMCRNIAYDQHLDMPI